MNILDFNQYILNINEGLIKTYDGEFSVKKTEWELSLMKYPDFKIEFIRSNNTIELYLPKFFEIDSIEYRLSHINSMLINRFGWFPSTTSIIKRNGTKNRVSYKNSDLIENQDKYESVLIVYEAKFDENIITPNKLYHLSIKSYKDKIIQFGISPKSKSKLTDHPDRIYVCKTISDCRNLIPRMRVVFNDQKIKNEITNKNSKIDTSLVIYEIDTNGLDLRVFKDPNYQEGFYILGNIPPDNISVLEEID